MPRTKPRSTPLGADPACRVIARPIARCVLLPDGQAGEVEIDGDRYTVSYHDDGEGAVYGVRLVKLASEDVYDVDTTGPHPVCDCKAASRWGQCRHQKALCILQNSL